MIRSQTCPICDKDLAATGTPAELFPFCSLRCREVDLYRWCIGQYAIVEPADPELLTPEPTADDEEE